MKFSLLLTFICLFSVSVNFAQTKKKNTKKEQAEYSNSYSPYTPSNEKSTISKKTVKKKKKKTSFRASYNKSLEQKKEDFQDLMVANAKKRKKEAKLSKKPQYSDPSYFGHKRKPKKRPVGKRKLCKECGIVH